MPRMKSNPGPLMTLGNAAAATLHQIVVQGVWSLGRARPRRARLTLWGNDRCARLAKAACMLELRQPCQFRSWCSAGYRRLGP